MVRESSGWIRAQTADESPMPASRITVGRPFPVQLRWSLYPSRSISRPGGASAVNVGAAGADVDWLNAPKGIEPIKLAAAISRTLLIPSWTFSALKLLRRVPGGRRGSADGRSGMPGSRLSRMSTERTCRSLARCTPASAQVGRAQSPRCARLRSSASTPPAPDGPDRRW